MLSIKRIIQEKTTVVGSLPDIDTDFAPSGRKEVLDHLRNKYPNIGRVANFATAKSRGALKFAAKGLDYPLSSILQFNKLIDPSQELKESLSKDTVIAAIKQDPKLKEVIDLALKFEGLAANLSVHAAAIVISPTNIGNLVPIMHNPKNPELPVAMYDMRGSERVGLVKYDFLGLLTLDTLKNVSQDTGIKLDSIKLDDQAVFEFLSSGIDLYGIFQMEKDLTRQICSESKPKNIEDLSAIIAVIRPACLQSGFHVKYINGDTQHKIPVINESLSETNGVLLYQEQLMSIAQKMAGLSEEQADDLRQGIGKKKASIIEKYREIFVNGSLKNGYLKEDAEEIYSWFEKSSRYAFNKSHSTLYAILAYYCAWFRYYYPAEFLCAHLNSYIENGDKLHEGIRRIRKMGFKLILPHINKSGKYFTVENGNIRFGLVSINGIGSSTVEPIINHPYRPFSNLGAFCDAKICGPKTTEILIKSGCFDELISSRNAAISFIQTRGKTRGLFEDNNEFKIIAETEEDKGLMEKNLLGIFVTKNPLSSISEFYEYGLESPLLSDLKQENIGKMIHCVGVITDVEHKMSKGKPAKPYIICKISDPYEEISAIIFDKNISKIKDFLGHENIPMIVRGYLNIDTFGEDEDDEEWEDQDIFKKGKITIIELKPVNADRVKRIVRIKMPDDLTVERCTSLANFIKSAGNESGHEVTGEFKGKTFVIPTKLKLTDELENHVMRNYGATIHVEVISK